MDGGHGTSRHIRGDIQGTSWFGHASALGMLDDGGQVSVRGQPDDRISGCVLTIGDGVVGSMAGDFVWLAAVCWQLAQASIAKDFGYAAEPWKHVSVHTAPTATRPAHAGICLDPLLHAQKRRENRSPRAVDPPSVWIPVGPCRTLQACKLIGTIAAEGRSRGASQFHNFTISHKKLSRSSTLGHCCVQNTEHHRVHPSARGRIACLGRLM